MTPAPRVQVVLVINIQVLKVRVQVQVKQPNIMNNHHKNQHTNHIKANNLNNIRNHTLVDSKRTRGLQNILIHAQIIHLALLGEQAVVVSHLVRHRLLRKVNIQARNNSIIIPRKEILINLTNL